MKRSGLNWKSVVALGLVAFGVLSVGTMTTYAAFSRTKSISQTITVRGASLFLDPGVWEVDDAVFFLYSWDSSNTSDNSWTLSSGKVGDNYCFDYPSDADHNKVLFVRMDPNYEENPSFDHKWNQTEDLDLPTGNAVVYTISGWQISESNTKSPGTWGDLSQ